MDNTKTLKEMNMGELWALAKSNNISIKGKTKEQLIKELTASVENKTETKEESKKEKGTVIEATLKDGTKVFIPAKDVAPIKVEKDKGVVIIKSVDGRELEASVGRTHWVGKIIEVPADQEDEIKRLLEQGGFYFI